MGIAHENTGKINGKESTAAKKVGKGEKHQAARSNEQRIQSFRQFNAAQEPGESFARCPAE